MHISVKRKPDTGDFRVPNHESLCHKGSSMGNNATGMPTPGPFTQLGPIEKFHCQKCVTRQESMKEMSDPRHPLLSCFHIKPFEHSTTGNTARKVD